VEGVLWHSRLPAPERERLLAAADRAGVVAEQDDATVARLRRKESVHCLARVAKRDEALSGGADHVALVRPSHPGNVGTAIRSLVAFGFTDLALVAPALDPWGPYVVRASVGLRFALRCHTFATLEEYRERFPRHALYLFDADGEAELEEVEFRSPFPLVFGPEGRAPDPEAPDGVALEGAHASAPGVSPRTVRIHQDNRVESLNLAISVSIAAYRAGRARR
jgi:TrmH family RNA methyltransferase